MVFLPLLSWLWLLFQCKKAHSVYQIEPPAMDHHEDDAYEVSLQLHSSYMYECGKEGVGAGRA